LDRAALADIVFNDSDARDRLNALLHPHIRRIARERERRAGPGQPIVHVVPLLFETATIALWINPSWSSHRSKLASLGSSSATGATRGEYGANRRSGRSRRGAPACRRRDRKQR